MEIKRGYFSKYAIIIISGGSPFKAAVDTWRFSNATRTESLRNHEGLLARNARDIWDNHFGDYFSIWSLHEAFSNDLAEDINMMLNTKIAYHAYRVDIQTGSISTIKKGVLDVRRK